MADKPKKVHVIYTNPLNNEVCLSLENFLPTSAPLKKYLKGLARSGKTNISLVPCYVFSKHALGTLNNLYFRECCGIAREYIIKQPSEK